MTNPFAINIIIHPRYFDRKVCKLRKNDSEIAELREQNLQLTLDIGNITNAQEEINRAVEEVERLEEQSEE